MKRRRSTLSDDIMNEYNRRKFYEKRKLLKEGEKNGKQPKLNAHPGSELEKNSRGA